jgi:quercetin dioxygenase-like cupin family protein/alkylhydroperoxidase/carboxymuconolactone decarboxylase family protein YurZ
MNSFISKFLTLLFIALYGIWGNAYTQQASRKESGLNAKQASIVPIAAYTATGDLAKLRKALSEGLDAGLSLNETKEILVQLYAYTGFPRSLNAISTLESVVNERKKNGIKDAAGATPAIIDFGKSKFEFGKNVQTRLTGSTATGAPQQFVPTIDTFLKEHLFADIFGRDNLDYQTREIATIAALASLAGTESQLQSHLNVGKYVGLSEQQLKSIVATVRANAGSKADSIFPKGEVITNNYFTGTAYLQMMVQNDSIYNTSIGNVTFQPGARTNWHAHHGGQILLVTSGKGYYQEQGKQKRVIRTGEVIKCLPGIIHWHGASSDSSVSHIAIGPNAQNGAVKWMNPVSDEEYNKQ